jgi:hypothetical protein
VLAFSKYPPDFLRHVLKDLASLRKTQHRDGMVPEDFAIADCPIIIKDSMALVLCIRTEEPLRVVPRDRIEDGNAGFGFEYNLEVRQSGHAGL